MKKVLSMLLVIAMVFTMMPMAAFVATNPTIFFETNFTEDLGVGDTFEVTCNLKDNEFFASMTLSLKWNEDAIRFAGFKTTSRGALETEVYTYSAPVFNPELGIVTGTDPYGFDTNGVIFTAYFEIIADSGELGIGLKDADTTEFEFSDFDGNFLGAIIDYSGVSGLTIGGKPAGAAIPENAPFSAITTDAGAAIGIEEMEAVDYNGYSTYYGIPYYHVQIPADATEVYVTHPFSADPFCDTSYGSAYGYYAETEGWTGGGINLAFEEAADGYIITMPLFATASDVMMGGEVEVCFVADEDGYISHAVAVERNGSYDPICFFTFEYAVADEGDDGEETYRINVEQTHGGTITVDKTKAAAGEEVFVSYEAATGYRFKNFLVNGIATNLENGVLIMPAEDVTISAVFELIPVTTYAVNIQASANGAVTADKTTAAAGEAVVLTVIPEGGYVLDTLTVMSGATALEVINNTFTMPAGEVTVSATFKKMNASYLFATSADLSAENGGYAVVSVKVTGHSDSSVTTYNAYDITLTFDSEKLEYIGYDGAVKSDNGQVKVDGNTIRIVGCGDAKDFETVIAALTFQINGGGTANVTVTKAQISDQETAIDSNIPEAAAKHDANDTDTDETPDETIILVPYTVSKPDFVGGEDQVLKGDDYTFWFTDTDNYTYTGLKVTVGGVEVTVPPANDEGMYVIENVEGDIEITVTQTPNSYAVDFDKELVEGDDTAIYGTDYEFTVTPGEGYEVESVTVLDAYGNEITYTYNSESGKYVIAGSDITGAFTIVVTVKEKDAGETTITFDGVEVDEVEGGLVQTAKVGKAFTFQLNKNDKFVYTVLVGDTELTENNGKYTIPGSLVVAEGVTVTIIKEEIKDLTVEVSEYINLNGKTMFLVTAKWDDKVLSYGDETMFYSSKYTVAGAEEAGAYCWLVISTDEMNTLDLVKAAAEEAITAAADGVAATAIGYDCDVNETTKVDVNDAQLAYDMYNAAYEEFTASLTMVKFLEADVSTDGKLDVHDVAAIINHIVNN